MNEAWRTWVGEELDRLHGAEQLRELHPLEPISPVRVRAGGGEIRLFSGNDYLGLSSHPDVVAAMRDAAAQHGLGPRGSPLVCGYTTHHRDLEEALAELKGTESALLFPTGYAANVGAVTSLAGRGCAVFSDALNHASIIDGCRLARRGDVSLHVFRHADPDHLAHLLEQSDASRKLVVTDAVFSMDGDLAPLPDLVEVKEEYGAMLMVDEAHATLVFGESGGGLAEHFGVEDGVDVHVGTLSKAAGGLGGFVATSEELRSLLLNRGRPYVFSTALPVPVVRAVRAGVRVARRDPEVRDALWERVGRVAEALGADLASPIVPIIVGSEARTMEMSAALLERGFHVPGIRPPTVPEGTSRLRVALSAAHTIEDIDALLDALDELGLTDADSAGDDL